VHGKLGFELGAPRASADGADGEHGGPEVIGDLLALAGAGDDELVGGQRRFDERFGLGGIEASCLDAPGAGRDVFLQRR